MPSGFQINNSDIDNSYITKSYVIDRYPELNNVFKVAALWVWGATSYGALGLNNATGQINSPVQTVSGGGNWKQVAAHNKLSAGIKTDGTLWVWGQGDYGQLGTNDRTNRSSPVQTVSAGTNWKQVANTYGTTAALKTDGTLWTWGRNDRGQLGTGNTTHRSSPVQTSSGGSNWKYLVSGRLNFAAIKTDGTLWMWGFNGSGRLGTNDTTDRQNPTQTVAAGTNWKQVSTGYSTGAIKTDGTLWVWGVNDFGQLGTNDRTDRSSPVQTVSAGTNWKQVSAADVFSTAAIKTDGTLWMWGRNHFGQLGTNNITNYSSPVQTISGGTNWKQVNVGYYHTSAIKTDGTLWSWGNNGGELGDGTYDSKSSPVQTIAGGTNWKHVAGRYRHILSIRDDSKDLSGIGIL